MALGLFFTASMTAPVEVSSWAELARVLGAGDGLEAVAGAGAGLTADAGDLRRPRRPRRSSR